VNVVLLAMTPRPLDVIYAACRQCYSAGFAGNPDEYASVPRKEKESFVARVVASGHLSPLEHVTFTFAVEGVSRVLTHQLVRHRIASYSQQSQRYVSEEDFACIMPPSIADDPEMREVFSRTVDLLREAYAALLRRFREKGITGEEARQDARFLLPQAVETKIVVSMNARELLHFFEMRCCARAQWEIRRLAERMLDICRGELPCVFARAGARCESLGYCPEGARFTCGRYPLKGESR